MGYNCVVFVLRDESYESEHEGVGSLAVCQATLPDGIHDGARSGC